jgi:hypothetical protein
MVQLASFDITRELHRFAVLAHLSNHNQLIPQSGAKAHCALPTKAWNFRISTAT